MNIKYRYYVFYVVSTNTELRSFVFLSNTLFISLLSLFHQTIYTFIIITVNIHMSSREKFEGELLKRSLANDIETATLEWRTLHHQKHDKIHFGYFWFVVLDYLCDFANI